MAFEPRRAAALANLDRFLPRAGKLYAEQRNYDSTGRDDHSVSHLSPFLRHRVISEEDVLRAVLSHHTPREAEKFIQEVSWRTYWKGWLEMRPVVWQQYRQNVQSDLNRLATEEGLRARFEAACLGDTDIECFNFWSQALVKKGYLHNHARMWFASIWIFTLELPWSLGADFFLRHLLDGDPASNTLSWRWVAGRQTLGKAYLATPENISTFTRGRFTPPKGTLAQEIGPLDLSPHPDRNPLPPASDFPNSDRLGLLMNEDDLSAPIYSNPKLSAAPSAMMINPSARSPRAVSELVTSFVTSLADDCIKRYQRDTALLDQDSEAFGILNWAQSHGISDIITPYAPVGPIADMLNSVAPALLEQGITLHKIRREYDSETWPHATAGFFKFKKNIPKFLEQIA